MTSYKTYQEIKLKYPNHLIAYFSEKLQSYVFLGEQGEKVKAVLGTNRINRELSFDIWMTKLIKSGYGVGVSDHLNKIN
jgi:DNA mismatch repair ATPase MutS